MSTSEIPKPEWEEFFRDFSRFHQGWIATLDVFDYAIGAQKEADELALGGIVTETQPDGRIAIEIMIGETTSRHITHTIIAPSRVRFECVSESEILQIEDEGDTTVLLHCHKGSPASLASLASR